MRQAMRVFRLDRVQYVALSDTTFVPPAAFDCLHYVTSSFAAIPDMWQIEVLLDTTLTHVRRFLPRSSAQLEACDSGVKLRASLDDLDMLARELARRNCPLTVVAPPELRHAFHRLAAHLNTL